MEIPSKTRNKATMCVCMHAKSLQLCLTLWDPTDYSPPGSSVQGILQTRILEWVAMPSSRVSSWPRGRTHISCGSCIADRFFTAQPPGKIQKLAYDPAIPPLGIYWEKTTTLKDICTPVSIVALFTIARTWKQPKFSSTDIWIKKLWYIYIWNITQP